MLFLRNRFGIPRTICITLYYNGIKPMVIDGCAGIPYLSRFYTVLDPFKEDWALSIFITRDVITHCYSSWNKVQKKEEVCLPKQGNEN